MLSKKSGGEARGCRADKGIGDAKRAACAEARADEDIEGIQPVSRVVALTIFGRTGHCRSEPRRKCVWRLRLRQLVSGPE